MKQHFGLGEANERIKVATDEKTEKFEDISETSREHLRSGFKIGGGDCCSDSVEDIEERGKASEINSEIPELIMKKHSKPDKRQPVLSYGKHHTRKRPSDLPKSKENRSNTDLSQPGVSAAQQGSQEILSSPIHLSDEKYYDASDNQSTDFLNSENKPSSLEVERSVFYESDSDLESIPSVSHFKQHTWKGSKFKRDSQNISDKNKETKRPFGKDEYVEGKWQGNWLIRLDSCQFTHPNDNKTLYIRNQNPGYLFTFDQEDFIARVCFDKLEVLDFDQFPMHTKRNFLKKIIITEIIKDRSLNDRNAAYSQLKQILQYRSSKTADDLECAEDIFQLSIILQKYGKSSNESILDNIINNKYILPYFKDTCRQLLDREKVLDARRKNYFNADRFYAIDLDKDLREIYECGVKSHKMSLLDKCSSFISEFVYSMISNIEALSEQQVLYISNKDINLFSDLASGMSEQIFSELFHNLQDALFRKVREIRKPDSLRDFLPFTHPIYFYLCKSFQELIFEISGKTDISVSDLFKQDERGKWNLVETVNWPSNSYLNRSLEQQYRFIFVLMKHFEPGSYSTKVKFQYKFKLLQSSDDNSFLQFFKWVFTSDNNSPDIPEDRLVWIYIVDDAIGNLLSKNELNSFEPLLKGYTDFINKTKGDHHESFRVVTHSVVRFIAQTRPYLSKMSVGINQDIFKKQMESINRAASEEEFNDFTDLIDVYSEYWKNRESIIEHIPGKFPHGKFKLNMESIRDELISIVNTVLSAKVKPQGLIKYFRSFNEFVENLGAVEFSWFIKKISGLTEGEVTLIDKDKESYKVLDPDNFIRTHSNIPCHYLIEIIEDLLKTVRNLLGQKRWSNDDNLNATSELLSAIKKSFLYLEDQPKYRSFDTFKKESTKAFASVIENSRSYEDFKKRVDIIGESFWYLRKQDEIDIEKAIDLYKKENKNSTAKTEETLKNCYNRYLEKFESYIQRTCNQDDQDKIKLITDELKHQTKSINISQWEEKFKKETLPELLAGLAAVWSIQESKDISSTGKSLKPHCIQILCVLRLLSVDKSSEGVDKHLAQVLTGQGKSLVLGLLSSLLALMGHKVRTVCYSKYLATRDQEDFDDFFKQFGIRDKITYGTFEEMANEVLEPEVNGRKQGLRDLVKDRILKKSAEQAGQIKHENISNTVLLIDEVDVFFSDEFYGNTYNACSTIGIPGLASIQEEIWKMASKSYTKNTILKEVEEFIIKKRGERSQDFKEFDKFLFKPGKYDLLKNEGDVFIKKAYDNQSLYKEHLDTMIDNAINVANGSDENWYINRFKVNDDGLISYRDNNGFYTLTVYHSYYKIFNYFRLKKIDYRDKGYRNYGYFNINCGSVSYAKLPKKYPLILGVSGTLTTLNYHERKAVREYYGIDENTAMPSFFGDSNLEFDTNNDFTSQNSEEKWLIVIFSHANSQIASGRSVLIFFDTDVEIDKFKGKFRGKFDRLHTLTENTEAQDRKKYVDEAGIKKTLTLATRTMGRGVDFKSSVAVEKNGGVHVIQTFFSLDIKEETQIKGRTARKDNKGTYELILCKEHLKNAGFPVNEETTVNYESLSVSREEKIRQKGSNDENRLQESEVSHTTTMEYFESFFKN